MQTIWRKRNGYAALFASGVILTAWFAVKIMPKMALIFGCISVAIYMFLKKLNRLLYDAGLICDNPILEVSSAVVSKANGRIKTNSERTIVSTFGVLIGSKVYKWGSEGVHGVRLKAIEIDRERIYLTFGDEDNIHRVELLHGLTDTREVSELRDKLWKETGVKAAVKGWQP